MTDRASIIARVINAFTNGKLPMSIKVDNVERDYDTIYERLFRLGKTDKIGMSTEKDRGLLWFRKR